MSRPRSGWEFFLCYLFCDSEKGFICLNCVGGDKLLFRKWTSGQGWAQPGIFIFIKKKAKKTEIFFYKKLKTRLRVCSASLFHFAYLLMAGRDNAISVQCLWSLSLRFSLKVMDFLPHIGDRLAGTDGGKTIFWNCTIDDRQKKFCCFFHQAFLR